MSRKPVVVVSLATAIASLFSASATTDSAKAALPHDDSATAAPEGIQSTGVKANSFFAIGQELLSLIVTKRADGTVTAQHVSHASHASHASHVSGH